MTCDHCSPCPPLFRRRPEFVLLADNKFSGRLRDSFASLAALDFFDARNNQFTGFLAPSLFEAPMLRILYLSQNEIEGTLPSNFGLASKLRDLYLDNNKLTGTVPSVLQGQLPALNEFLLQNNTLSGVMPASICNLFGSDGDLDDLWADCDKVTCSCCTECFP